MGTSLSRGKTLDAGHFGITPDQLPPFDDGPIDLQNWFPPDRRACPLELEIGSGKGTFLCQAARLTPQANYVGVEYARAFWRYAADRCRRNSLENVRVVNAEASGFVRHYVRDLSLRQAHIYFPDPWPKTRHHKRRLIQESFLRLLHSKLEPNGSIRIATDHAEYFQWITDHAQRVAALFEPLPFQGAGCTDQGELVGTNFERKYLREGRTIHAVILRKTS